MKIAVVGSGISGLSAAWLLHARHQVADLDKPRVRIDCYDEGRLQFQPGAAGESDAGGDRASLWQAIQPRWAAGEVPGDLSRCCSRRADDVVGIANGRVSGKSLHWTYTRRLPVDDDVYEVTFDDWMYRQEDGVVFNRSVMKKFGFRLGEVTLFFKKRP